MSEDRIKTEEGAALWRRFGEAPGREGAAESPDALLLAAQPGRSVEELEASRLEPQFIAEPALLEELLALRESLASAPGTVPEAVLARAQALHQLPPALRRVEVEKPGWLDRVFGAWLRPAVPAFATLAVVVACAGAFELGRYQATQLEATAKSAASEVPVDLLLDGLL